MSIASVDVSQIVATPSSHYDMIQEGPFATVGRTWVTMKDGEPQWVVVKMSSVVRKFVREPHDITKEVRLLSSLQHPNIVAIIGSFRNEAEMVLNIYMPYFPFSLSELLASPSFSPYPLPSETEEEDAIREYREESFLVICKSIMIQTISALAYLQDEERRIAHRDLKPENIMLTKEGCVKLIDFGVAFKENETDLDKRQDLWPEHKGRLYFEVSTGAYRAPELLFGARNYDPMALDLWSLGACFAEFFTPLRLSSDDTEDGDDDDDTIQDEDEPRPLRPFTIPKYLRIGYPGSQWRRDTLFNGDRGEIGLAWSIFKIFGTPTPESWPEFEDLPGAKSIVFNVVPGVPLKPLLPNLPLSPNDSQANPSTSTSLALDLLAKFLAYPLAERLPAKEALRHPWFTSSATDSPPILLPKGLAYETVELTNISCCQWAGKTLQELLDRMQPNIPRR